MASSVIGALRVNLGIDTATWNRGLTQAESRLAKFGTTVVRFGKIAAAALATGAIAAAMKRTINFADDMGKSAQKFGVPVEALSEIAYAAELADVSMETLGASLRGLSKSMVAAQADAAGPAARAFKALGVEVLNADGSLRTTTDTLSQMADAFAATADGPQKVAVAQKLMSKSGAEMIPFLNAGSAAFNQMAAEARAAGVVISQETAADAETFNDSLTRLKAVVEGVALGLMSDLLPHLNQFTAWLLENGPGLRRVVVGFVGLGAAVFDAAKKVNDFLGFTDKLTTVLDWMKRLATAFIYGGSAAKAWAANLDAAGRKVAASTQRNVGIAIASIDALKSAQASVTPLEGGPGQISLAPGEMDVNRETRNEMEKFLVRMPRIRIEKMRDAVTEVRKVATEAIPPVEELTDAGLDLSDAFGDGGGGGAAAGVDELAQSLEEMTAAGKAMMEEMRTPQEAFAARIAEINQLYRAGAIDLETWERANLDAQDTLKNAAIETSSAFEDFGDDFGDLTTEVIRGTKSISEGFSDMLSQLAGDLTSTLLSKAFGDIFGGIGTATGIKLPAWFSDGFASGTSNTGGSRNQVRGVVHGQEAVIPLPRGGAVPVDVRGAGGGVVVNIHNAPAGTQVEERQGPDGTKMIEVFIRSTVKGLLGDGSMDGALRANYGVGRRARGA